MAPALNEKELATLPSPAGDGGTLPAWQHPHLQHLDQINHPQNKQPTQGEFHKCAALTPSEKPEAAQTK